MLSWFLIIRSTLVHVTWIFYPLYTYIYIQVSLLCVYYSVLFIFIRAMGRSKQSYKRAHQSQAARALKQDLVNDVYNYKSQIQRLEQEVELLTLQNKALLSIIRKLKPDAK